MNLQKTIQQLEDQAHKEMIKTGVLPEGPSDMHIYATAAIGGALNELAFRIKQEIEFRLSELTDFLPFDDED